MDETERGAVAGVQTSLNQSCDLVKFVLVICLADVVYFGYLVLVSVGALCLSFVLYLAHAVRASAELQAVPISEAGPFRKSMITIVPRQDNYQDDSSFDEEPPAEHNQQHRDSTVVVIE